MKTRNFAQAELNQLRDSTGQPARTNLHPESMIVPTGDHRSHSAREVPQTSGAQALVSTLETLGVEHAFALFGGGIAPVCRALHESKIRLLHFRHEAGAAFAAIESSLASGKLTVVVSTTGPGLTNMYTGMVAARWEGAKVLFLSGHTPSSYRGRWAFQETSRAAPGAAQLFDSGVLLHYGAVAENLPELEVALTHIARGASASGAFVAHLGLPMSAQTSGFDESPLRSRSKKYLENASPSAEALSQCEHILNREKFAIWAGFGARSAANELLAFAERWGAHVMCTPRAKGCFPETHPLYLGTTGLGGHTQPTEFLAQAGIERMLVLGTKLGEMSSFWDEALVPPQGFIHVDLDPSVFNNSYPHVSTIGVRADCRKFLTALLRQATLPPAQKRWVDHSQRARTSPFPDRVKQRPGLVRPSVLMQEIQELVIDGSEATLISEAGNSYAFCNHYLRFNQPHRYRVSTGFGSMGHACTGVLGMALATGKKAFAVVGDGSMLMLNEMNTAASYGIDVVWIIFNDSGYGMIAQGMASIGWEPFQTQFDRADFVSIARGMRADGLVVKQESELRAALAQALLVQGPFVLDVWIDPNELAPTTHRNQSLLKQGVNSGEAKEGMNRL